MRPPVTSSGLPWESPSGCGSCSTSSCFPKIPRDIGPGSTLVLSSLPSRWRSPSSCGDARPRADARATARCLGAGRRAELGACVVDVKIDRPLGEAENLRNFGRRFAARHPGQCFHLAIVELNELRPQLRTRQPGEARIDDGGEHIEIDRLGDIIVRPELAPLELIFSL